MCHLLSVLCTYCNIQLWDTHLSKRSGFKLSLRPLEWSWHVFCVGFLQIPWFHPSCNPSPYKWGKLGLGMNGACVSPQHPWLFSCMTIKIHKSDKSIHLHTEKNFQLIPPNTLWGLSFWRVWTVTTVQNASAWYLNRSKSYILHYFKILTFTYRAQRGQTLYCFSWPQLNRICYSQDPPFDLG